MDIFRHKSLQSVHRATSCVELRSADPLASLLEANPPTEGSLRRCASTRTPFPSGWGIVPVLNELVQLRDSGTLNRTKSTASSRQLMCHNCRRLYFRLDPLIGTVSSSNEGTHRPLQGEPFCSLDCKSSFACKASMQALVEAELRSGDQALSKSTDDDSVVTVDDVMDLSI